ncbi:MAG: glycosyltransferase family 39 protein [Saprospiraceae bacterium]
MRGIFPKLNFSQWDLLAILICSIPAFYLLGTPAIYIWDEAVYANASLDVANGGSWIPLEPYNTKPPLVLWLQAICLLIFPWPEFAVRLPSALAVVGILIIMTLGLKRWGLSPWARILAMVAFVANQGFIRHHIARTGDLDAVMSFFVFGYCMVVLDAIHFKRWTNKHTLFFFIMWIAAFYSKSIGGWMMLAPVGIIWLLSPMRQVLMTKKFILGIFGSLLICLMYYVFRESMNPGLMKLTWQSEYLRMFKNVMPWHEQPFSFYFKNFVVLKTYTPWIFAVAAFMAYGLFFLKDKSIKDHIVRWTIPALGYMVLISIPAVKLEWYDAPVYPFFAMILGVVGMHLLKDLPNEFKYAMLIACLLLLWQKLNFIRKDIEPRHAFEYEGYMLREATVNDKTKVFMPVETPEHRLQLDFYKKWKQKETGEGVEVLDSVDQILIGDQIIVRKENLTLIGHKFSIDTIRSWNELGYEIKIN